MQLHIQLWMYTDQKVSLIGMRVTQAAESFRVLLHQIQMKTGGQSW